MTTFDLLAGETVRLWWIGRQLVTSTTDNKLSEIKGQVSNLPDHYRRLN